MATESGANGSSTPSSNSAESYIGCFISLISKCEIRYEGVLTFLDVRDSTIALKDVRSYGTEGRKKDGPQVPPSDKVYEYILFRGSDIKNLQIKSPSTSVKAEEQIYSDPAIIQSQYSDVLNSPAASVCGRSFTESVQRKNSPALSSKTFHVGVPSHQSVTELGLSNQPVATQAASHPSSFSTPEYWQGHSGSSNNGSHSLLQASSLQPPSIESPSGMQNRIQTAERKQVGRTTSSEGGLPASSASVSSPLNLTHSSSPTTSQISDSLDTPSLLSAKASMPLPMTFDGSNMPVFSSPRQVINSVEGQISGKYCPDPTPIYPLHSVHMPASSHVDSTLGPFPTPQSLLTPDQFAHPRKQLLTQNLNPNWKDMGLGTLTSSASPVLMASPASQAPLLPLPTPVQKPQYSASPFTEEFDFEAMNEKFKKEEVWGSLGKTTTKTDGVEDIAFLNLGDRECRGMIPRPKSAYEKEDFFDTISCNSMTSGSRNGQNRLSERIKQDSETFGNFHQRPNVGYGGHGTGNFHQRPNMGYGGHGTGNFHQRPNMGYGGYRAGRGENFRSPYYWGMGYGYPGRGRGAASFPF